MQIMDRRCIRCGGIYSPSGLGQKFCDRCRPLVYEEQRQARYQRAREKKWLEQEKKREQADLRK